MDTLKEQKEQFIFECYLCDFKCSKKYNLVRHQSTDKHRWIHNVSKMDTKKRAKEQPEKYSCECGKQYKYSQGLSKHKKTCVFQNTEINENKNDVTILTNLVLEVVKQNKELISQNNETQKQNQELQKQVIELCKNGTNNTTITNSNNILHTKTFNLNVFLNERCKDAMNITDFVDSLKLQLSDLESVGKLGFV